MQLAARTRRAVSLLLLLPQLCYATASFDPDRSCVVLFSAVEDGVSPVHGTKPEAKLGNIARADLGTSVILEDLPVKNQRSYGCCWISTDLARWERVIEEKLGKHIPLSQDYLVMASLFFRIEEAVHFGNPVIQGGWAQVADWMATRIGLVPESAWTPKADFRSTGAAAELVGYLNGEIGKFQIALENLKAKPASSHVDAQGNKITREQAAWNLAQKTKSKLYKHLRSRYGNFPSRFELDGVEYTPHSFAKKILPDSDDYETFTVAPTEKRLKGQKEDEVDLVRPSKSLFTQFPDTVDFLPVTADKLENPGAKPRGRPSALDRAGRKIDLNSYKLYFRGRMKPDEARPLSQMKAMVVQSLQDGDPVFIATPMVKDYYRRDVGVMSLSAHGATAEQARKAKFTGGHAMLITGVYRDSKGNVVGFRIQNSWGKESGELGYYYMDVDYFDAFVRNLTFKRKIEIWDPSLE